MSELRCAWEKIGCPVFVAGPYRKEWIIQKTDCRPDTTIKSIFDNENYNSAKKGADTAAALSICRRALDKAYTARVQMELQSLRRQGYGEPILVAPCKPTSKNVLAKTAADLLGKKLNIEVDTDIQEVPCKSRHDMMDCRVRFFQRPEFTGPVQQGRLYILVDDMVSTGVTLAELRSHIVKNGGHVAFACSLASSDGLDRDLKPTVEALNNVEKMFRSLGEAVKDCLTKTTGLTPDALTHAEAMFFGSHKGRTALIRNLEHSS